MAKKFDFGGYATKANLKCKDGRVISPDAFKECDGQVVPLVWQHMHDDPKNVLGYAVLEHREDGTYSYCSFNDTPSGQTAKQLVAHGDVVSLSIYANELVEKSKRVLHGAIKEVSLVLAGANPEARIDNLVFSHGDGYAEATDSEEAFIFNPAQQFITHSAMDDEDQNDSDEDDSGDESVVAHAETKEKTVEDVFETLNDEQKELFYALIGEAVVEAESAVAHSDKEGETLMAKKNVFDPTDSPEKEKKTLTHSELQALLTEAEQNKSSLKKTFLAHAQDYGIENIDYLFPDARNVSDTPYFISRRMEWVSGVLDSAKHSPFSRIKSIAADITADEARAKGYIKGTKKTEEVIKLLKRATLPTTIYKKQKLDRDDVVDITDIDVVAWLKSEMRIMLDEEIARAILVGDNRAFDDPDKISEESIRPIYTDDDLYAYHIAVAADATTEGIIEAIIRGRTHYKGSGMPTFYTTASIMADMLLVTDKMGRRLYNTEAELAALLRVKEIVEVPVMENLSRTVDGTTRNLIGIVVNLIDYTIGADQGGQISMFDDFDIDYNQQKYLIETRISGALANPESALVIEQTVAP